MRERFESLARELARLGWTPRQIQGAAQEVAEHWDDLEREGREGGRDATAAARFADERLGNPEALAHQFAETMRSASWWGRHPLVGFVLLPPLALLVWFVAWISSAFTLAELARQLIPSLPKVADHYLALLWWVHGIHYLGVALVPAFFWWCARRSFCSAKWGWWACAACAMHGLFNQVALRPHSLSWGYGVTLPADWLPVLAPLLVGGLAHWRERRQRAQLVRPPSGPAPVVAGLLWLVATTVLGSGCATSKTPRQRGWIGGEVKVAKAGARSASSTVVPAFPRELKGLQSAGILVTALRTNEPAHLGGLREGDLILKVGPQRVGSLRAFRRRIDAAPPGAALSLTVFRDGAITEARAVVGRETFTRWHSLSAGLLLSREWDLFPNPDFSLIALGYKRHARRAELSSPETQFIEQVRATEDGRSASERGAASREGWEVWLALVSVGRHNRILAQETAVELTANRLQ